MNEPTTAIALVAIVVLAVAIDVRWKRTRRLREAEAANETERHDG